LPGYDHSVPPGQKQRRTNSREKAQKTQKTEEKGVSQIGVIMTKGCNPQTAADSVAANRLSNA
jgi:hypothetical protein